MLLKKKNEKPYTTQKLKQSVSILINLKIPYTVLGKSKKTFIYLPLTRDTNEQIPTRHIFVL